MRMPTVEVVEVVAAYQEENHPTTKKKIVLEEEEANRLQVEAMGVVDFRIVLIVMMVIMLVPELTLLYIL
jgi:hypothetical protein